MRLEIGYLGYLQIRVGNAIIFFKHLSNAMTFLICMLPPISQSDGVSINFTNFVKVPTICKIYGTRNKSTLRYHHCTLAVNKSNILMLLMPAPILVSTYHGWLM